MHKKRTFNVPVPLSLTLRGLELISAAVVAGIIGYYLHPFAETNTWPLKRFIFAETWAGISIILCIVWNIPRIDDEIPWWSDFFISIGWWTAFGLIIRAINCGQFFSLEIGFEGSCRNWKAAEAFCFISGIAWFVTGIFGIDVREKRRQRFGRSRWW